MRGTAHIFRRKVRGVVKTREVTQNHDPIVRLFAKFNHLNSTYIVLFDENQGFLLLKVPQLLSDDHGVVCFLREGAKILVDAKAK